VQIERNRLRVARGKLSATRAPICARKHETSVSVIRRPISGVQPDRVPNMSANNTKFRTIFRSSRPTCFLRPSCHG
jgi:hypothetical protein